jgi:hypothetical protein
MGNKALIISGVEQRDWVTSWPVLSTAQAALGADKSAATVRALTATGINRVFVPQDASAMSFNFLTGADGNTDVVNLYAIRGDYHYELVCTFTLTGGTQTDGDKFFCDTIAITADTESWLTGVAATPDVGANSVAKLALNTHGYSEFLFIATTLADALKIQKVRN